MKEQPQAAGQGSEGHPYPIVNMGEFTFERGSTDTVILAKKGGVVNRTYHAANADEREGAFWFRGRSMVSGYAQRGDNRWPDVFFVEFAATMSDGSAIPAGGLHDYRRTLTATKGTVSEVLNLNSPNANASVKLADQRLRDDLYVLIQEISGGNAAHLVSDQHRAFHLGCGKDGSNQLGPVAGKVVVCVFAPKT